jgi:hypothetical protein
MRLGSGRFVEEWRTSLGSGGDSVQMMKTMKTAIFFTAVAAVLTVCAHPKAAACGVRVSEAFGYDPVDSTRFVRAALESDHPVVVFDRQDGPWHATPIEIKDKTGKTIVFEKGSYVCARRGAFKEIGPFLRFTRCSGIRIVGAGADVCGVRMWRDDYADKTKYKWSEWRHALSFLSCEKVSIEGISANESGGDGLYIGRDGTSGGPCRDFTVKNCVFAPFVATKTSNLSKL